MLYFYFSQLNIVVRELSVVASHVQKRTHILSTRLGELSRREYTRATDGLSKSSSLGLTS